MKKISKPTFRFTTVCMLILFSITACVGSGGQVTDVITTLKVEPTISPTTAITLPPTGTLTATAALPATDPPTSTLEPAATWTSAPTNTATPTQDLAVIGCPGAPDLQLKIHDWAMVSKNPPLANKVRSQPGLESEVIGNILPGERMLVEDGPTCLDGFAWWFVQSFNGLEGWTVEGDAENYWLIPIRPEAKWESDPNSLTLTASQVTSAVDIEGAINEATSRGTRAGTLVLDGREGPFIFSGDDRTINIFVSNLNLIGVNQAVIRGCDGGLFFDDFPTRNILVEGIEFDCKGNGVVTSSSIQTVVLRNNIFRTAQAALSLGGALSDWLITLNWLETGGGSGIEISGEGSKILIVNNHITGIDGIALRDCSGVTIRKNILHVNYDGITLFQGTTKNLIERNTIQGVYRYGIFLVLGVEGNQVLDNLIFCKPKYECLTIYAPDQTAEMNTIRGNRP